MRFLLCLIFSCVSALGASTVWYAPTTNQLVLLPATTVAPTVRTFAMLGGFATTNSGHGGPFLLVATNGLSIDMQDVFATSLTDRYWQRLVMPSSGVPTTRTLTAGAGLTGGGDLSADRIFDVGAGTGITVSANDVALDTASARNTDHSAVTFTAGAGLTGGGDLTASRIFDIGAGTGVTVSANDVAINQAFTPTWTGLHTFNNGANVMNSSKLGVGTTSAGGLFHVLEGGTAVGASGGVTAWFQRSANTTDNSYIGIVSGTSGIAGLALGDTGDQDIGLIYYNNANNSMAFRTDNSDRLSISSSGTILIPSLTASKFVKTDGSSQLTTGDAVTSVAVTAPDGGLTLSGSPITTTGTIALEWSFSSPGDILYASDDDTMSGIGIGSEKEVLTVSGSSYDWVGFDTVSGDTGSGAYTVQTTDGTATTAATITPANSTVCMFQIVVVGIATDNSNVGTVTREWLFHKNGSGTLTQLSVATISDYGNYDFPDPTISSGSLLFKVQNNNGDGKTVKWKVRIRSTVQSTS